MKIICEDNYIEYYIDDVLVKREKIDMYTLPFVIGLMRRLNNCKPYTVVDLRK
jgi:hypothetical protein